MAMTNRTDADGPGESHPLSEGARGAPSLQVPPSPRRRTCARHLLRGPQGAGNTPQTPADEWRAPARWRSGEPGTAGDPSMDQAWQRCWRCADAPSRSSDCWPRVPSCGPGLLDFGGATPTLTSHLIQAEASGLERCQRPREFGASDHCRRRWCRSPRERSKGRKRMAAAGAMPVVREISPRHRGMAR